MKKYLSILFILLLLAGCSSRRSNKIPPNIAKLKNLTVIPADVKPEHQISLKKDEVYGSTTNVLIGRMGPVAVDDSGRVFIAAEQKGTIDVFAPDGRYITHFGRRGKGPGELESIGKVRITLNRFYIYDSSLQRIITFLLHPLSLENTITIPRDGDAKTSSIARFFVSKDGRLLLGYPSSFGRNVKRYLQYYLMAHNGGSISGKVFEQKAATMPTKIVLARSRTRANMMYPVSILFIRMPLTALSPEDQIYTAWSGGFLIKVHNLSGRYLRAFYYPYANAPFDQNEFVKKNALKSQDAEQINFPKTWPALKNMKIDNRNRLWVSTIVKNMKVYQWWVLSQKGKLLARFEWPRNKPIKVIKNGYLYTQETDTSNGDSKVVRYKIMMR